MEENKNQNAYTGKKMATGLFADPDSTNRAYSTLNEKGYQKDDINVIMSDETRKKHYSGDMKNAELGNKSVETAGTGAAIGGTIGAIAGVLAAIGTSLAIPGLGLLVAGPIAAGLAGAGAGSITGGIVGALVGLGISEDRAKIYEHGVKNGHVVMGVHPKNEEDAKYFERTWSDNQGQNLKK